MAAPQNSSRSLKVWFCALYAVFIIYGSLVPLDFNNESLSDAVEAFLLLPFFDFDIGSRADWFTNYLLFIPLSYTLLLINPRPKSFFSLGVKLLFVLILLVAVSVVIEFCQMFISVRVSSFKDVFAQFLGVLTSFCLYFISRQQVEELLQKLESGRKREKWLNYAVALIVVFTIYNLMPLDLSISPAEIHGKWASGKINFIPFASNLTDLTAYLFGVITDIVAWGLISFCYLKSEKYQHTSIFFKCLVVAICIEILQLFVMSRITDITDIFTAAIGVFISIQVYIALSHSGTSSLSVDEPVNRFKMFTIEAGVLIWCVILLFFAVYPSVLIQSKAELADKWKVFFSVPLETYWQETSYGAITQLMRKVILMIPLGILVSAVSNKYQLSKKYFMLFIALSIAYLVCLELIQLVLVGKIAVFSDIALNLLGLFIGCKVYLKHGAQISSRNITEQSATYIWQIKLPLSLLAVFMVLIFIKSFEHTPYNVKELFAEYHILISSALITLTIFFTLGFPNVCVSWLHSTNKLTLLSLISGPFIHSFLLFNLVYITFPSESIHDILGYPLWKDSSHYLELCYRFIGFFIYISAIFFIVVSRLIPTKSVSIQSARWSFNIFFIFVVLPISFFLVVVQAGTDNVTELLNANGYSIKLLHIVVYLFMVIGLSFRWLPLFRPSNKKLLSLLIIATVASAPAGYALIQSGLQEYVVKYGQVFSALQFLLSPSRYELLSVDILTAVFISLHFVLMFAIFSINWSLSVEYRDNTGHHSKHLPKYGYSS
jgi:VanZ family protein